MEKRWVTTNEECNICGDDLEVFTNASDFCYDGDAIRCPECGAKGAACLSSDEESMIFEVEQKLNNKELNMQALNDFVFIKHDESGKEGVTPGIIIATSHQSPLLEGTVVSIGSSMSTKPQFDKVDICDIVYYIGNEVMDYESKDIGKLHVVKYQNIVGYEKLEERR